MKWETRKSPCTVVHPKKGDTTAWVVFADGMRANGPRILLSPLSRSLPTHGKADGKPRYTYDEAGSYRRGERAVLRELVEGRQQGTDDQNHLVKRR